MKKLYIVAFYIALALPSVAQAQKSDHNKMPRGQHQDKMNMSRHAMKMGTSGLDALKALSGKEFNIAFMSQMIAHHQAATDMAQQALQIAKHAETKKEVKKVITEQTKEIKQMNAWLQKWYDVKISQEQADLVKADMKDMMAMKIESDRMFFETMIPHHQAAIVMSQIALKQSDRAEVKQLAQNIIKAQKAEIARYKSLLHHVG